MKQLWAPWRMEFILGSKASNGCPFCLLPKENKDVANLILFRSQRSFVIMNRYPYNHGHLLVIPNEHQSDMETLSDSDNADLTATLQKTIVALKRTLKPDGINVGMNLGHAAGAGIPGHLHYHVIPRWIGDTNFMPLLNQVRVMNQHLDETYHCLVAGFS